MRISVPKEIMNNEHRVALTPTEVRTLVTDGHELFIESGAGAGASFPDEEYVEAGGAPSSILRTRRGPRPSSC